MAETTTDLPERARLYEQLGDLAFYGRENALARGDAALAGVAFGMNYLRQAALSTYGNQQGQAEWDRWREDVAKDAKAFADAGMQPE